MLPSPSSSPRQVLVQTTNITRTPESTRKRVSPPTPPTHDTRKGKRKTLLDFSVSQKRLKLDPSPTDEEDESEESDTDDCYTDSDVEMDNCIAGPSSRSRVSYGHPLHRLSSQTPFARRIGPSTLPILRSFVSSQKSDVFKCESTSQTTYLTPPYACSFSHAAKRGGRQLLAVATEQGTIHILNTTKRADWDAEPQRISLQSHENGVFDVKWNADDTSIISCSADYSVRITDITTQRITHVLQGHYSTVKCASLDPSNPNLLATGGRDGAICIWDLRMSQKTESEDQPDLHTVMPQIVIHGAHEDSTDKSKRKVIKRKNAPGPRSVTGLLHPESDPYGLVSSCSYNGVLQYWDLRAPPAKKGRPSKPKPPACLYSSSVDPTTLRGSRRARGLISLSAGVGPSKGLLFGLGADSRVHTYSLPHLTPQSSSYEHSALQANSFYLGISVSPCGRWLSSGAGGATGSTFVFDVENASRLGVRALQGVELRGRSGEVGATDWAEGVLAACSDDGTVRLWRPDLEVRRRCEEKPEDCAWDWSWAS